MKMVSWVHNLLVNAIYQSLCTNHSVEMLFFPSNFKIQLVSWKPFLECILFTHRFQETDGIIPTAKTNIFFRHTLRHYLAWEQNMVVGNSRSRLGIHQNRLHMHIHCYLQCVPRKRFGWYRISCLFTTYTIIFLSLRTQTADPIAFEPYSRHTL